MALRGAALHLASCQAAVPELYGLVGGAAAVSLMSTVVAGGRVMSARKKYGVKYPAMYATVYTDAQGKLVSNAEDGTAESGIAFNSAQRGHQNALETYPGVLALTLVGGLAHPVAAAASLILWTIGADRYSAQYTSGGPEARNKGVLPTLKYVGLLSLLIINFKGAALSAKALLA